VKLRQYDFIAFHANGAQISSSFPNEVQLHRAIALLYYLFRAKLQYVFKSQVALKSNANLFIVNALL